MRPSEPSDALDGLVLHLQAADLTVSIDCVLRLRVLFGSEGLPNEPDRVANMVAAVIARQPRELEAARTATLAWLQQRPTPRSRPVEPPIGAMPSPAEAPAAPRRGLSVAIAIVLLLAAGVLVWASLTTTPLGSAIEGLIGLTEPEAPVSGVPYSAPSAAPESRVEFLETAPRLEIRVEAPLPPDRKRWPFWALACFGAGIAVYSWRRTRPPGEPVPPPGPRAPPRRHRRPASRSARFVTGRDADTLAWGIDRFLSDEPTARLDLSQTVSATVAAGGAPNLRWARAKQHREIWLWVDDAATRSHPEIEQLVSEVRLALGRVGLQPRIAHFWGVPDALTEGDAPVRIDQLEDARMMARVAVLTDGRLWTRWRSEPARRREADGAFRRLSSWRQLAVIDFADGAWPIAEHLQRHDIAQRTPAELIGWLGEFDARVEPTTEDDRIAWAAACALCPEPITEDDALALLQQLAPAGIDASPWAIRDLRTEAPGPGTRLRWSPRQRATLISWLAEAEAGDDSLLARARRFWADRLGGDDPHRVAQRAWLDLFEPPRTGDGPLERAIATLLPLTHADDEGHLPLAVGDRVRQALPADLAQPGAIRLPWRWTDLDLYSRLRARAIGLGKAVGGLPEETVVRPGRVGLAAGLGAGVAIAAVALAVWPQEAFVPSGPPVVVENTIDAQVIGPRMDENGYWIYAATPWGEALQTRTPQASRLFIGVGSKDCEAPLGDDALLVSCGTRARPERVNHQLPTINNADQAPQRTHTIAFIEATSDATPWRVLGARLLDTGSVDLVVVAQQLTNSTINAVQDQLAATIALGKWQGMVFLRGRRGKASKRRTPYNRGWAVIRGDGSPTQYDRLAEALGDGEPASPSDVFERVSGDLGQVKVRGKAGHRPWSRNLPWHVQFEADRAAVRGALGQEGTKLDAAAHFIAHVVRVPDTLVWWGGTPIIWALVGARSAAEFDKAMDARKALADELLAGSSPARRAAVDEYLELLRGTPALVEFWTTVSPVAESLKLDAPALSYKAQLINQIRRRLTGWQRTALRRLALRLYAANRAVVGDFPFARAETDANVDAADALMDAIAQLRALPIDGNPFVGSRAAFLGRNQGDWKRGFEELVQIHDFLGEQPIRVDWAGDDALVQVEDDKGRWRTGRTWTPGERARLCIPGTRCREGTGSWSLLRLIDAASQRTKIGTDKVTGIDVTTYYNRFGDLSCRIGEAKGQTCVGWIRLGRSKAHFVPRAVDLLPLQDSPGVPMVKPVGKCPYTCQLQGYPNGDAVGGMCMCQDDAQPQTKPPPNPF